MCVTAFIVNCEKFAKKLRLTKISLHMVKSCVRIAYINCCDVLRCLLMTYYRSSSRYFWQEISISKLQVFNEHCKLNKPKPFLTSCWFFEFWFGFLFVSFSLKCIKLADNEENVEKKIRRKVIRMYWNRHHIQNACCVCLCCR